MKEDELYRSPWIYDLTRSRTHIDLAYNTASDLVILGAGIAGIASAYFCLRDTEKEIILIDAGKVASGASGHNGGFLATYFERSFKDMVDQYGLEKVAEAQNQIDSAWDLLKEILSETKLDIPFWEFTGFTALANKTEVLERLEDNYLRREGNVAIEPLLISNHLEWVKKIELKYKGLYELVDQKEILDLLETNDPSFIALMRGRKGCMNSAALCENLISWMLKKYSTRLRVYENTYIKRIVLKEDHIVLESKNKFVISCQKLILCTNGFEGFKIINTVGKNIDAKFHHLVKGIVGYMAGYYEDLDKPAVEISYLPKKWFNNKDLYTTEPYFYLTRRPFHNNEHSLICIGGPELLMEDTKQYTNSHVYPNEAKEKIDQFLKHTYKHRKEDEVKYQFLWHGLMGFTPSGVRLIGSEPLYDKLYYNLGCNGVGLLPSIYGGKRISQLIAGQILPPSIFDPKNNQKIKK